MNKKKTESFFATGTNLKIVSLFGIEPNRLDFKSKNA
jgi:hypothetical protein